MDMQTDLFGGEVAYRSERNRPAPKAAPDTQLALFASDAGQFQGQTAATDLLGDLPGGAE